MCLIETNPAAGTRRTYTQKNMRKFLFPVLVCAILCAGACSDDNDDNGDGPAGNVEMLYGTWGASHMQVEAMGERTEMDVDASLSTITFNTNGTLTEVQENNMHAYGTWNYNPSTRILHIDDSNFDIEYDWYVKELTDNRLTVDFTMTEEGIEMRMIITYSRLNRSSQALASDRTRHPAASAALGASLFENVERNTK